MLMLELRISCNTLFYCFQDHFHYRQWLIVWGGFFKRFYFTRKRKIFWYDVLKWFLIFLIIFFIFSIIIMERLGNIYFGMEHVIKLSIKMGECLVLEVPCKSDLSEQKANIKFHKFETCRGLKVLSMLRECI